MPAKSGAQVGSQVTDGTRPTETTRTEVIDMEEKPEIPWTLRVPLRPKRERDGETQARLVSYRRSQLQRVVGTSRTGARVEPRADNKS